MSKYASTTLVSAATFEQEFLAHIVRPNNQTVSDWIEPQIQAAYVGGTMPKLLPAGE